jgi:hypothetical protein
MEELPTDAYSQIMVQVGTSNTGSIEISLPDITEQHYSANEVKRIITPLLATNPAATWTFGGGRGPMSSSPINISVSGSDSAILTQTVNEIATIIASFVPEETMRQTDLSNGSPKSM